MATPRTDALIASLTLDDALAYEQETDHLMWIEVTLLDPNNISHHMAERVELALIKLLLQRRP